MGERGIRSRVIKALRQGKVQHEAIDGGVNEDDLLQSGQVSAEEVIDFLKLTRGMEHEEMIHPKMPHVRMNIFRSNIEAGGLNFDWYVKCYCLSEIVKEVWFVSVHSI